MKHSIKTVIGAVAAASIVFAVGTAQAQTKEEAGCHAAIAKSITKYQGALAKNYAGCHKSRDGGKIGSGTDCNDAVAADLKGKRSGARAKAQAGIDKKCDVGTAAAVLAFYPRCPSPVAASDDGGATTGIDTFTELGTCLLDLSEAYGDFLSASVMGTPPSPGTLSKEAIKCHGTIGKNLAKLVKTIGKTQTKCQSTEEKALNGLDYGVACVNGAADTAKGKNASTVTKSKDAIDKSCTPLTKEDLGSLQACGSTGARLKDCIDDFISPASQGLAAASLELPGTCAAEADVIINAGFGDKWSATRLDSGWKGTAHYIDVIDDSLGAVTLSGCDADCENCTVTHNPKNGNCRCSTDATVECTTINAPDVACGGNTCHCMFGPPLAISASATPVCVVNRFQSEFVGGTQAVGEYDVATETRALVHTGISQTRPCPTCDGGTCDGGLRDGLPCTVNATHPDFGAVSFDCPPSPGANISGSGLLLDLTFESGTSAITAAIPSAGTFCDGASDCHCSVCSGNAAIGCTDDAVCIANGAGTCGVALANNPKQNNCDDGTCTADGDGGVCNAGPTDSFCDGFLKGNGQGIITCSTDGDCDANDCNGDNALTPGECGTCDLAGFRQCFLPTVTATGTPGIFSSDGVSSFCSGQTGNGGVDNAGGLPGPGRVKLNFDFNLYCSDGTTIFEAPGGSNCP